MRTLALIAIAITVVTLFYVLVIPWLARRPK